MLRTFLWAISKVAITKKSVKGNNMKLDDNGIEYLKLKHGSLKELSEICYGDDAFEQFEPTVSFPLMWGPDSDGHGGKEPKDPLTIYINMQNSLEEGAVFETTLSGIWKDFFDALQCGNENLLTDKDSIERAKILSSSLRELADEIDSKISDSQ